MVFSSYRFFSRTLSTRVKVLSIALTVATSAGTAGAQIKIQARDADQFVDSMGVNVHMEYTNTPYQNYEAINQKLQSLGIRHVRDEINDTENKAFVAELQHFGGMGISLCGLIEGGNDYPPPGTALDPAAVVPIIAHLLPSLEAVEGPNEPDDPTPLFTYGIDDLLFPWGAVNESESLWSIVKGSPVLSLLPVLAMSEGSPQDFTQLAAVTPPPIDYATYGNMHAYQGGLVGDWGLKDLYIPYAQDLTGDKPFWTTEMGYHNYTDFLTDGEQQGVSQRASAIYLPIAFLSGFNQNVMRTFSYELIDEAPDPPLPSCTSQDNPLRCTGNGYYGLLNHDGTPKPAYTALQNLLALLREPAAKPFEPGSLAITFSGATSSSAPPSRMHYTLLQKSNGDYYLAIWNDLKVFQLAAALGTKGYDIYPLSVPVTVNVSSTHPLAFTVYAPNDPSAANPTGVYTVSTGATSIQINLPAKVLLIKISAS
jgi:hypothetical protein